jgi:formamidopyrimidine-DNA glycosylase
VPELPDVTVYTECLERHVGGTRLKALNIVNSFVLRTVTPSAQEIAGRRVQRVGRLGKRIVVELADDFYIVFHLMIAGRLHWLERAGRGRRGAALAKLEFETGTLLLTEAGSKRRASLHLLAGKAALQAIDPGGMEILQASEAAFIERVRGVNHTLKRALTDPHLFSGIGNAYSDEILHRARLSPFARSDRLSVEEVKRLVEAARETLMLWIERLRAEAADGWPKAVTAFRPEMAVHGKFGEPCPVCAAPVQRIVYAENETNYCARCQTGGKVLADRALSRLLHGSWPRNIDELG